MRKSISPKIQTNVLVKSRRRCCICYGLHRHHGIKQGQIAHVDRDASNSTEDNLVFLCLEHHAEYDSTARQTKGITKDEIKIYRDELYDHNNTLFTRPIENLPNYNFDYTPETLPIDGTYIRVSGQDSAEIRLTLLTSGMYHVSGISLHGENWEEGPNFGQIDFFSEFRDGKILYLHQDNYIELSFSSDKIEFWEEGWFGKYGVGVSFNGTYERVSAPGTMTI